MKSLIAVLLAVVAATGSEDSGDRLWGISDVILRADHSVTLIDAGEGPGAAMQMFNQDTRVSRCTLLPGGTCALSDREHATITYELVDVSPTGIHFIVTSSFIFPGHNDETRETRLVAPYQREKPIRRITRTTRIECSEALEMFSLPSFACTNQSVADVITRLDLELVNSDPHGEGIPFVVDPQLPRHTSISFSVSHATMSQILKIIEALGDISISVEDGWIEVYEDLKKQRPNKAMQPTR